LIWWLHRKLSIFVNLELAANDFGRHFFWSFRIENVIKVKISQLSMAPFVLPLLTAIPVRRLVGSLFWKHIPR
jgi:hypothetical protein